MKKELYIKNMVCDRCKMSIEDLLKQHQAKVIDIQLGKVIFEAPNSFDLEKFDQELIQNGFELVKDSETKLVEEIKVNLLNFIAQSTDSQNFSDFLAEKTKKDYSVLSKTFKKQEGLTIEKYLIHLKIEKVKELIQMKELSFSEIAYQLNYNSISHLSGQFKSITGMTMSDYQNTQNWNRSPLDKIM